MHVVLAYKNFAANRAISHIGLGVTALNSAKSLRTAGINADVWPIISAAELRAQLRKTPATHVVISAPWIPTPDLALLCAEFRETQFAVTCHSNLGFLQADPGALRLVREGLDLRRTNWNFQIAANSARLSTWVHAAYRVPCAWLPNLYHLDEVHAKRERYTGGTLRIGTFGATRVLKNLLTAAGAALEIANEKRADLEFWISSGRSEGAGSVVDAVKQMLTGLPHVKLIENGWQTWPRFRQTVRHMHLLLQPSYTESFNVVTADGVAEGVPSVVSDAIDWAPSSWKAPVDDAHEIARVGRKLLHSRWAPRQGMAALETHNRRALRAWKEFLEL
ncbi:MAG TPA: glycosyltransferase [Bryobacteraceae bacterium]|nr:glycosyltransferase [Bryobacteraceae bacterium]